MNTIEKIKFIQGELGIKTQAGMAILLGYKSGHHISNIMSGAFEPSRQVKRLVDLLYFLLRNNNETVKLATSLFCLIVVQKEEKS